MLTYHPAFDSYHCAYRTLLIVRAAGEISLEIERVRIWDFYLVFPSETRKISFPRDLPLFKKVLTQNSYEQVTDSHLIFARMKPFQLAAYRNLAAFGLIEHADLSKNRLVRTNKRLPRSLVARMDSIGEAEE
ncbi:MAG TPA: ABC-three component system middle component 5, partial [Pyrinomonadaceae bacterium]|nr:ABC-three component system middle component 5 [Pyrinomonadaceae bacterium]